MDGLQHSLHEGSLDSLKHRHNFRTPTDGMSGNGSYDNEDGGSAYDDCSPISKR